MTEKELHRLRRQDLLQLLLSQGKEALEIQTKLNSTSASMIQLKAGYERLKDKLDEKDAVIEKLKGRLDEKDARICELEDQINSIELRRRLRLAEAGSIAEASLKINEIFELAQKAVEQYFYDLQHMREWKAEGLFLPEEGISEPEKEDEQRNIDE